MCSNPLIFAPSDLLILLVTIATVLLIALVTREKRFLTEKLCCNQVSFAFDVETGVIKCQVAKGGVKLVLSSGAAIAVFDPQARIHEDDVARFSQLQEDSIHAHLLNCRFRLLSASGDFYWVQLRLRLWSVNGPLRIYKGNVYDMTREVDSDILVVAQRSLLHAILDATFLLDSNLRILNETDVKMAAIRLNAAENSAYLTEIVEVDTVNALQIALHSCEKSPALLQCAIKGLPGRVLFAKTRHSLSSGADYLAGVAIDPFGPTLSLTSYLKPVLHEPPDVWGSCFSPVRLVMLLPEEKRDCFLTASASGDWATSFESLSSSVVGDLNIFSLHTYWEDPSTIYWVFKLVAFQSIVIIDDPLSGVAMLKESIKLAEAHLDNLALLDILGMLLAQLMRCSGNLPKPDIDFANKKLRVYKALYKRLFESGQAVDEQYRLGYLTVHIERSNYQACHGVISSAIQSLRDGLSVCWEPHSSQEHALVTMAKENSFKLEQFTVSENFSTLS